MIADIILLLLGPLILGSYLAVRTAGSSGRLVGCVLLASIAIGMTSSALSGKRRLAVGMPCGEAESIVAGVVHYNATLGSTRGARSHRVVVVPPSQAVIMWMSVDAEANSSGAVVDAIQMGGAWDGYAGYSSQKWTSVDRYDVPVWWTRWPYWSWSAAVVVFLSWRACQAFRSHRWDIVSVCVGSSALLAAGVGYMLMGH